MLIKIHKDKIFEPLEECVVLVIKLIFFKSIEMSCIEMMNPRKRT